MCWRQTIEKNFGFCPILFADYKTLGYNNFRLRKELFRGIIECNANCKCNAKKCYNRVVQRGLQLRLEVFKTAAKGWGVRTCTDLPPGVFVSNYLGEMLDGKQADRSTSRYLYSLADRTAQPPPNTALAIASRLPQARVVIKDIADAFMPFFPRNKILPPRTAEESSSEFVIDAKKYGNISRFYNVSGS